MSEYPWPMVTTPAGEDWPVATVGLECPYPSCNWKSIFRVTATHGVTPSGRNVPRSLTAHINAEHAHIYDRMGLEQDLV